jgi:hypothetical protein
MSPVLLCRIFHQLSVNDLTSAKNGAVSRAYNARHATERTDHRNALDSAVCSHGAGESSIRDLRQIRG